MHRTITIAILVICYSLIGISQTTNKINRVENYLAKYSDLPASSNCYCSTQNEFSIPVSINKKLYPYRGEFAIKSADIALHDRINSEVYDSLIKALNYPNSKASYYGKYWYPSPNLPKNKLVDLVITKLFDEEIDLKYTELTIDSEAEPVKNLLVPLQTLKTTQFGRITTYPNLKAHYYRIAIYNTAIEQRDLGIYMQITHYFTCQGKTYSVTFNFDHNPLEIEFSEMHHFFSNFGQKCVLKPCGQTELDELVAIMSLIYSLDFEKLYSELNSTEQKLVVNCAVEKIRQLYTCDEFMNSTTVGEELEEIAIGCIEYIKL
jgi:hypothetical protein